MDFLICSSTPPLCATDLGDSRTQDQSLKLNNTAPTFVDTSSSENSESTSTEQFLSATRDRIISEHFGQPPAGYPTPVPNNRSGEVSPAAICSGRRLSAGLVTAAEVQHPVLAGRPTIVVDPNLNDPMAILQRNVPPRAPRRPSSSHGGTNDKAQRRGSAASTASQRSVAPLPSDATSTSSHRQRRRSSCGSSFKTDSGDDCEFRMQPSPLRLEAWSEAPAESFNVRGPNYMKDRVKQPSAPAAYRLMGVDLINTAKPIYTGMCAHPTERVQQALKRERETGVKELPPFVFAVNLCIPGPTIYHQVSYFAIDDMEEIEQGKTPLGRLMQKFIFGDSDHFRNHTFKLIPRIVEGNYIVRKAVGSKPSILGKKLNQIYIRGDRYFEMIIDIASDPVAQRIVRLALGYAKTLVVDMMFVLEGTDEETLPEQVFGGVRMKKIDFRDQDGKRTVGAATA